MAASEAAVTAVMEATRMARQEHSLKHSTQHVCACGGWWSPNHVDELVARAAADAAVDADRASIQAETLREFAGHDLHNVIPYSEIANDWYHRGLIAAQEEAGLWADRIEAV